MSKVVLVYPQYKHRFLRLFPVCNELYMGAIPVLKSHLNINLLKHTNCLKFEIKLYKRTCMYTMTVKKWNGRHDMPEIFLALTEILSSDCFSTKFGSRIFFSC